MLLRLSLGTWTKNGLDLQVYNNFRAGKYTPTYQKSYRERVHFVVLHIKRITVVPSSHLESAPTLSFDEQKSRNHTSSDFLQSVWDGCCGSSRSTKNCNHGGGQFLRVRVRSYATSIPRTSPEVQVRGWQLMQRGGVSDCLRTGSCASVTARGGLLDWTDCVICCYSVLNCARPQANRESHVDERKSPTFSPLPSYAFARSQKITFGEFRPLCPPPVFRGFD